ncbi:MAG: hypothetical protein VCB25_06950, partial [Myxococcota bacterium]
MAITAKTSNERSRLASDDGAITASRFIACGELESKPSVASFAFFEIMLPSLPHLKAEASTVMNPRVKEADRKEQERRKNVPDQIPYDHDP